MIRKFLYSSILLACTSPVFAADANDTFVEATDTALESHTPTGTSAGAGWVSVVGAMLVDEATDTLIDNNNSAGNRYRMTTDLGDDQMDVQANFTVNFGSAGDAVAAGVLVRANAAGTVFVECGYDRGLGGTGAWYVDDAGGVSDSSVEAWPGGTVTIKCEARDGTVRVLANGVEKASISSTRGAGNQYGGVLLINFTGTSVGYFGVDDYQSTDAAGGGGSAVPVIHQQIAANDPEYEQPLVANARK